MKTLDRRDELIVIIKGIVLDLTLRAKIRNRRIPGCVDRASNLSEGPKRQEEEEEDPK
jgi:hypothetical protein